MEENLSWRAKLAKSNINILNIDDQRWFYEFMYHPRAGQTKWCKTYYETYGVERDPKWIAGDIEKAVLALRKELEG